MNKVGFLLSTFIRRKRCHNDSTDREDIFIIIPRRIKEKKFIVHGGESSEKEERSKVVDSSRSSSMKTGTYRKQVRTCAYDHKKKENQEKQIQRKQVKSEVDQLELSQASTIIAQDGESYENFDELT